MELSDRLRFIFSALLLLFLIVYSLVERQYSISERLIGDLCAVSNVTPHWSHVVIVQNAVWDEEAEEFIEFQGVEAVGGDISIVRTFNDARYINRYQYHQVLRWAN